MQNLQNSSVETSLSSGMAKVDTTAMKETLRAQQQLLQKLYAELEEERECSATAASEVLGTTLRLQREKATVEMEASHYKRMAEEKICHAETCLGIFKELVYQKEMEIASLEFQLQAYEHKLVSMGCDLTSSMEFKFLENDQHNTESDQESILRRINTFPAIHLNNIRASPSPIPDVNIPLIEEESAFQENFLQSLNVGKNARESACGIPGSYGSQIKWLDEKMKVISDFDKPGGQCEISLPEIDSDKVNRCETVHARDVFEVPTTGHKRKVRECGEKREEELNSEAENRLRKRDLVPVGMVESNVKIEPDSNKIEDMLSTISDIKMFNPISMAAILDLRKDGMSVDYYNAQDEFQKVYQRIERLERDRIGIRQEIIEEGDKEEQLRLLEDMRCQLDSIRSEIRSWNTKNAPPKDDVCLDPLQEAMLYFWM